MNTTEGNKLIAEFMAWELRNNGAFLSDEFGEVQKYYIYSDMKFNLSWNWFDAGS